MSMLMGRRKCKKKGAIDRISRDREKEKEKGSNKDSSWIGKNKDRDSCKLMVTSRSNIRIIDR